MGRNSMKPTRKVLGHLLLHSLAPISLLLVKHCLIHSHAPLRSFVFSLARCEAHGKKIYMSMNWMRWVYTILTHTALVWPSVDPCSTPSQCTTVQNSLNIEYQILGGSERRNERTSEWPNTYVPIFGCSKQPFTDRKERTKRERTKKERTKKERTTKEKKKEIKKERRGERKKERKKERRE